MKQGKPLITFVMILLAAALACYFAYYVLQVFQTPFTTTYAYEYELYDSVEAEHEIRNLRKLGYTRTQNAYWVEWWEKTITE